ETDNIDPREFFVDYENRPEIDRWILSKYNSLLKSYAENMEIFEVTRVVREISEFVVEDLSNWYIRRNRRRFWKKDVDEDKKSVYNTTYEILLGIAKLVAPFTPFIAEEIYRSLTENESVHLDYIPKAELSLIDTELEDQMELVRTLVTLGRASREKANIKVRQPLQNIIIDDKYREKIEDFVPLIKEELNVKNVEFGKDLSNYMDYELKPNFKEVGRILGKKIKAFQNYLASVSEKDFVEDIKEGLTIELEGEETTIEENYVEIRVSAKEGFDVENENGVFVILDTSLNVDLLKEGYAREFISKVQQMRKTKDFDVLDHIRVKYVPTEALKAGIDLYKEKIKEEILALSIEEREALEGDTIELNGENTKIEIEKE
ncbi:MAG: DUF5915 domain-containing protein, partial [Gallicola sp.]|nr:DUF5915 domain-containing protein [Gallicola sp.]